jgi:hypothetical protein
VNTLDALGLVSILSSIIVAALYVAAIPSTSVLSKGCLCHDSAPSWKLAVFFCRLTTDLPGMFVFAACRYQSKTILIGTSNIVAIVFILGLFGTFLLFLWYVVQPADCSYTCKGSVHSTLVMCVCALVKW